MIVKGTPPQWQEEIRRVFQEPSAQTASLAAGEPVAQGPGRLAERRWTTSPALMGDRDWPGLAQGFPVERRVTVKQSGAQRAAVVDGGTRLAPDRARPAGLLRLVRQPWQMDNKLHGVRAVTFDEARSHVRAGSIPQVMAAFRTTAMGVLPWAGDMNSAAACRRRAAPPWAA